MAPRDVGRVYAIGRAAVGAAMLLAPRLALAPFFGREAAAPAVSVLARAVGARDLVIGMIALHTLEHPAVGPRWQRTCAAVDAVDGLAMLAAGSAFPVPAVAGFAAMAGGGAATGLWVSRGLATRTGSSA